MKIRNDSQIEAIVFCVLFIVTGKYSLKKKSEDKEYKIKRKVDFR